MSRPSHHQVVGPSMIEEYFLRSSSRLCDTKSCLLQLGYDGCFLMLFLFSNNMFVVFTFSKEIISSRPERKRTRVGLFVSRIIIINKMSFCSRLLCIFHLSFSLFCFFWKNGNTKNQKDNHFQICA